MRALAPAIALLVVLSAVAAGIPASLVAGSDTLDDGAAAPASPAVTESTLTASAAGSTPRSALATSTVTRPAQVDAAAVGELNVLSIPPGEATQSSLQRESVELGSGLAFASMTADMRVSTGGVIERIEAAETDERRQQLLLQEVSAIEQRLISLRARQRQAIDAYARGDRTPRRLLYDLASIDATARELEDRREQVQSLTESTPGFSIPSARFGNIELELNTLTGPVRGHAAAVLSGEADSARFFIQTGPDSVAIAVIRDGTYVREVYREPLRTGEDGEFTLADAVNATERAYPTIAAQRLRDDTLGNPGSNSARVTIEHERGRLVAFVDSGSQRVFKEFQYRPIDQVAAVSSVSATRDGLNLTAYRTYPGGPVRLQLNSTTDAEPVDAQLTVGPPNGRSSVVGRTGDDGSLWTLAPAGAYQATAIDGSSVVVLSVSATQTPSVYGAVNESSGNESNAETMTSAPTG